MTTEAYRDISMGCVLFGCVFVLGAVLTLYHLIWLARAHKVTGRHRGWKDVSAQHRHSGSAFLYQREIAYTCPLSGQARVHADVMAETTQDWLQHGDPVRLLVGASPPHRVKSERSWFTGLWLLLAITLVAGALTVHFWPDWLAN